MSARPTAALATLLVLGIAGCSQTDRSQANASVDAAASAAAAVAHAVASDAARAVANAPAASANVRRDASGAAASVRSGASTAERAVDDATRDASPPAKNFARATAVKAKLIAIDAASGFATNVVAAGDVVHLNGKVSSAGLATRFESAAMTVPGVRHVAMHLGVDASLPSPLQPARDLALGAAVRANLAAAGGLAAVDLDVRADAGAVTLAGTVANADERTRLERAARGTPGVSRLDDTLTLR